MKFKSYTGISWSLLELAGLLEDEDSHVYYEKIKKHLALHPYHLTNLNVALNEILHASLNSYDSELQGFLLAYKNPKLLTGLGDTFYDSCYIHIDIEADFYVFRPKVGHTVKGIVNKKGYNHIGVLVHKAFNVSIPKTPGTKEWPGDKIEIGQEVKFTITQLDLTSRLPFIRGTISQENYLDGCKLHFVKKTNRRKKTVTNESFYERGNESDNSCNSNVEDQTPSQRKKSKKSEKQISPEKSSKRKRHLENGDIPDEENKKRSKKRLKLSQELDHSDYEVKTSIYHENSNANIINSNDIDTSTKKKKRSEKSSKKKSLEESQVSDSEFDYSTVKIKVEKDSTSTSDSEVTTDRELKKHEKKSKKQSKKSKYSDSIDNSIDYEKIEKDIKVEDKKHSKKHKLLSSDYEKIEKDIKVEDKKHSKKHKLLNSDLNDSTIEIKVEGSPKSSNTHEDNNDTVNHRRKRIKKSLTDSESEISNVRIKKEKNSSDSDNRQEEDRKDIIPKIIKTEKDGHTSRHSRNDTESENYPNSSPTKRKRKREKTPVVDFENTTIKEEKLDDYPFEYTQNNRSSENINDSIKIEYDAQYQNSQEKSSKKLKDVDIKLEPEEVTIKVEEDNIKKELDDEDARQARRKERKLHKSSPKKHSKNDQSDSSTTSPKKHSKNESLKSYQSDSSSREEIKYNISSPKKKKKSKRSSSVES